MQRRVKEHEHVEVLIELACGAAQLATSPKEKIRRALEGASAIVALHSRGPLDRKKFYVPDLHLKAGEISASTLAKFDDDLRNCVNGAVGNRLHRIAIGNLSLEGRSVPSGMQVADHFKHLLREIHIGGVSRGEGNRADASIDARQSGVRSDGNVERIRGEAQGELRKTLREVFDDFMDLHGQSGVEGNAFTLIVHHYLKETYNVPSLLVRSPCSVTYALGYLHSYNRLRELRKCEIRPGYLTSEMEIPFGIRATDGDGYELKPVPSLGGWQGWRSTTHTHVETGVAGLTRNFALRSREFNTFACDTDLYEREQVAWKALKINTSGQDLFVMPLSIGDRIIAVWYLILSRDVSVTKLWALHFRAAEHFRRELLDRLPGVLARQLAKSLSSDDFVDTVGNTWAVLCDTFGCSDVSLRSLIDHSEGRASLWEELEEWNGITKDGAWNAIQQNRDLKDKVGSVTLYTPPEYGTLRHRILTALLENLSEKIARDDAYLVSAGRVAQKVQPDIVMAVGRLETIKKQLIQTFPNTPLAEVNRWKDAGNWFSGRPMPFGGKSFKTAHGPGDEGAHQTLAAALLFLLGEGAEKNDTGDPVKALQRVLSGVGVKLDFAQSILGEWNAHEPNEDRQAFEKAFRRLKAMTSRAWHDFAAFGSLWWTRDFVEYLCLLAGYRVEFDGSCLTEDNCGFLNPPGDFDTKVVGLVSVVSNPDIRLPGLISSLSNYETEERVVVASLSQLCSDRQGNQLCALFRVSFECFNVNGLADALSATSEIDSLGKKSPGNVARGINQLVTGGNAGKLNLQRLTDSIEATCLGEGQNPSFSLKKMPSAGWEATIWWPLKGVAIRDRVASLFAR